MSYCFVIQYRLLLFLFCIDLYLENKNFDSMVQTYRKKEKLSYFASGKQQQKGQRMHVFHTWLSWHYRSKSCVMDSSSKSLSKRTEMGERSVLFEGERSANEATSSLQTLPQASQNPFQSSRLTNWLVQFLYRYSSAATLLLKPLAAIDYRTTENEDWRGMSSQESTWL